MSNELPHWRRRLCGEKQREDAFMAGISFSSFAGQNWLITPAALAVNEAKPSSVAEQSWLIQFSGVGILDLKGNNENDWRRETLTIFPDVAAPLQFAINRHAIPVPTSSFGHVSPAIVVEQIVPYAAISSAFEKVGRPVGIPNGLPSVADFGFAVDEWRPNPFFSATDVNNRPVSNIFTGIDVDVAIRNTEAIIHRASYQITIIGKIAFLVTIV
jgi:hypothetical protein